MEFLKTYAKEIVALLTPLMTWMLARLQAKAKLFLSIPHTFTFLFTDKQDVANPQPPANVFTASYFIRNGGKVTVTKVEVVFNYTPQFINIWPIRHHEINVASDNRYILIFGSLSPNEAIGIEAMSIKQELPQLLTVRCDQCVAERIDLVPQPIYPRWQQRLSVFLVFAGIAAVTYMSIVFIQFLVLKTPSVF